MSNIRKLTYEILEIGNKQHSLGKLIDIFLIALIIIECLVCHIGNPTFSQS